MTVSYSRAVATNSHSAFLKLLLRWKGSVYKAIWIEFIVFLIIFMFFSLIYRLAMTGEIKRNFEHFCLYCCKISERIPVGLFLGFYVNIIVRHWWQRFLVIPWPDSFVLAVCTYIQGDSDAVKIRRRTLIRYVNLTYCLYMRDMSSRVRLRYPTLEHIIEAGLMTQEEKKLLLQSGDDGKKGISFLPVIWAMDLITQMREEGAIPMTTGVDLLCRELRIFRRGFGEVYAYNYINVPLAYTQISTIAIYSYFILSIFAWQLLDPAQNYSGHNIDLYIPLFGLLRLAFIMGWLKVAEILINPFGTDEDDFEMDEILERNVQFSLFWLDSYEGEIPDLSEPPTSPGKMEKSKSLASLLGDTYTYKRQHSSKSEEPFWGSLANVDFTIRERPSPG
ncbi:chloride channel activity [Sparganum proliferum]